jgi:DNA-binding Lrp family transcriptional regulator
MRPLGDRSLPGYCSRCGTWLGSSNCQRAGKPAFVRADLEYEVWASNQIGELIAVAPTLLNEPTKEMIRDSLFAFIDYAAGGNRPGFAREFGLKKNTVQSWGSQRPVPQTDLVLKLCYQTGISLFDFLVSKTYLEDEHWLHRMKEIKTRAAAQIVRRNPEDVQKALMTALKEKPPRSIKEISEGLGYANTCTIERLFPSLCKKLRIRYRKLRVNRIQWRRTPIDDALLKEVLLRALNNELPPSIHRLTRDLGLRHSEALRKRFPDLCEKIIYRRMTIRQKGLDRIEAGLNAALTEVPPPSITKVANRLGYCNHATLSNNFPELCERVSQRYRVALRQRNDAIREELKSALAQSLPPTLREIGKKVSRDRSYFCVNFPTFARAITEKRRKQQRRLSISKTKAVTRQIRRVAKQLYSEGLYPSMRFVKARLAGQMTFDTKHLSDVLREVRRELGLPHHLKLSV